MYRVFIFLIFIFISTFSFAETILLKVGKVIEAPIVERTDDYIKVDMPGGTVNYDLDDIKRIDGEDVIRTKKKEIVPEVVLSEKDVSDSNHIMNKLSLEDVEKHYQNALNYGNQGLLEDALKEFSIVVSADPTNLPEDYYKETIIEAYKNMGVVYMKKNELQKAIESFKKAVSLDPKDASALYYLAGNCISEGKIKEGKDYYKEAMAAGFKAQGQQDTLGEMLEQFKDRKLTIDHKSVFSGKIIPIEISGNPGGDNSLISDMIAGLEKYALTVGYKGELTPISVELIRLQDNGEVWIEKWTVGNDNSKTFWFKCDSTPPPDFPLKIMIQISEQDDL